jgi:hypothetical protein
MSGAALDVPPSPGTPTFELLFVSASVIDTLSWLLKGRAEVFPGLTGELRDRAAELRAGEVAGERPVSEEDLAAHLLAEAQAAGWGKIADLTTLFARSLLSDFRIVKSPTR